MYRIFTSPLLSFRVPLHHHGSRLIFHGPLPSSRVPSSPSRVPFHFQGSPPLLQGSPSIFTAPLPFSGVLSSPSWVSFHFHRSPSIFMGPLLSFTGPLRSSWDPSDESIWVSKPSSQLLSHVTIYYDFRPMYYDIRPMHHDFRHSTWSSGFKANQIVITIWEAMHMYRDFSHSTLACHAHVL